MAKQNKDMRGKMKRQLSSYLDIVRERRQIERLKAKLEEDLVAPKAQTFDGMPRSGGDVIAGAVAAHVDKVRELLRQYKIKELELVVAQKAIEDLVGGVPSSTGRQILRYRYLEGLYWEQICVKMGYSWRQVHRIHSETLDALVAAELTREK